MLAFANDMVARAARRLFADHGEAGLWTIAERGRVVGVLVCEEGAWRLAWFADADPRLVSYGGPVTGDIEALAEALGARLGQPVSFESLPT